MAEGLQRNVDPDRTVYLGGDDALDQAVAAWARSLVGDDPSDDAIWGRAALALAGSGVEGALHFVRRERARLRLRKLEQLPAGTRRATEWVGERALVLIDDEKRLDENDLGASSCFIFGRSDGPVVKRVAARWFLSPGAASRDTALVLDIDPSGTWRASVYEHAKRVTTETLHWSSQVQHGR